MGFDNLVRHRPPALPVETLSAVVTQVSGADVLVTPVGSDTTFPLGPCRGVKSIGVDPIPVGAHVLVVFAGDEPWIVAVDE